MIAKFYEDEVIKHVLKLTLSDKEVSTLKWFLQEALDYPSLSRGGVRKLIIKTLEAFET